MYGDSCSFSARPMASNAKAMEKVASPILLRSGRRGGRASQPVSSPWGWLIMPPGMPGTCSPAEGTSALALVHCKLDTRVHEHGQTRSCYTTSTPRPLRTTPRHATPRHATPPPPVVKVQGWFSTTRITHTTNAHTTTQRRNTQQQHDVADFGRLRESNSRSSCLSVSATRAA